MIKPTCCTYAELYITLRYPYSDNEEDPDFIIKTKPIWVIRGADFDKGKWREAMKAHQDWFDSRAFSSGIELEQIALCPKCGERMPEIKLIDNLPDNIPVDQGGYCGTCEERSEYCTCVNPYELWELA